VRPALLRAVWWTSFAQGRLGFPWNDSCGSWSTWQVDPLNQVILTSFIRSNRRFLGRPHSSKLCPRERRCIGLGTSHGAGAATPAGPIAPTGPAVPRPCCTLVRISPKMCTCTWKSQHNSWNFISTKNVHEICRILLSNPRFWWLNLCC
jgi:hypothetical protein